jgi:bacterioferritin-associated ferredoxin
MDELSGRAELLEQVELVPVRGQAGTPTFPAVRKMSASFRTARHPPALSNRRAWPAAAAGIERYVLPAYVSEGWYAVELEIPGRRVANKSQLPKLKISYQSVGGRRTRHSEEPIAVYVCLCNALTDRQVTQAATAAGTTKPSKVYAACGCRAQCGQCVKALVVLLRGTDCTMPELQGAD